MTYVRCARCKKEMPMDDLRMDRSGNYLVCPDCYAQMQSEINAEIPKDIKTTNKKKDSMFNRLFSFFKKNKEEKPVFEIVSENPEDDEETTTKPIVVKEQQLPKKEKKREEKIKFICNRCKYKFKLKENTRINHCLMCGSKDIEPYQELDANTILNSVE